MDSRAQQPVALRILRPYSSVDDLLDGELDAFSSTGLVLLGAPQKPEGVVIRFQLCLIDGTIAMHGEGRVLGFRPAGSHEEAALMVRFTRLDARSKELLDRAMNLRLERESLLEEDHSDVTDISAVPIVEAPITPTLEPPNRAHRAPVASPLAAPVSARELSPASAKVTIEHRAVVAETTPTSSHRHAVSPPPSTTPNSDRVSALERLRHRQK